MLDVNKKLISILKTDATLNTMVNSNNIMFGPVDIAQESQASLTMPQINLRVISETQRSIPQGARDIHVQLDIWSRVSQLEVENIYEQVLSLLSFISFDQGSTHAYWERLGDAIDQYETDRRVWHRSANFVIWAQ